MNFDEIQKLLEEGKTAEANAALDQLMKDNPEAKAMLQLFRHMQTLPN